jgi:hypothetical protein
MKQLFYLFLVFLIVSLVLTVNLAKANPEGWVSPTGFDDPYDVWLNEPNAYDENTGSYAYTNPQYAVCNNVPALDLTLESPIYCQGIRYFQWATLGSCDIWVDFWVDGEWVEVHHATDYIVFGTAVWKEYVFEDSYLTDKMRIRLHLISALGSTQMRALEFDFWEVEAGPTEYNFYGTVNSQISVTSQKSWSFDCHSSINQTFSIASLFDYFQTRNFYGAITQLFSVTSRRMWIFNVQGFIQQVFGIEGWANLPTAYAHSRSFIIFVFVFSLCALIVYVKRKREKSLIK